MSNRNGAATLLTLAVTMNSPLMRLLTMISPPWPTVGSDGLSSLMTRSAKSENS